MITNVLQASYWFVLIVRKKGNDFNPIYFPQFINSPQR